MKTTWEDCASEYNMGFSSAHEGRPLRIRLMGGGDKDTWAVYMDSYALGKDGNYYIEPSPSSRSERYLEMCRYDSRGQALNELVKYEKHHYASRPQLILESGHDIP